MKEFLARVLSLILVTFFVCNIYVDAQVTDISMTLIVENVPSGPSTGLIVVQDGGTYRVSTTRADTKVVGVITEAPALSTRRSSNPNAYFVNNSGQSFVKASNKNGKITKGDNLTTSEIPGTAIRSTDNEFIVGVALEDFDSPEGLVRADIKPGYSTSNAGVNRSIISLIRSGTQSLYLSPINSLRYVLAAVIGIASFLFGFSIFSKISGSGIQALGRNPLARRTIEFNIIIEFILNIAIIVFGLVIAYFILAL